MQRRNRILARVGLLIAGIVLAYYWWRTIVLWQEGVLFSHNNYWNAPVGTITAFILLAVLTPFWIWAMFRLWNWTGHKVEDD